MLNVLLIGSGGREHALAWKLAQSPRLATLYAAPGNPGIARHATLAAIDPADHGAILRFCRDRAIDFVVVGPEAPLVAGLVDDLAGAGIRAFGPNREAARLEGSKGFTKDLCAEANIPTAAYRRFTAAEPAKDYIRARGAPIVVKADGLAAGKGVTVAETVEEALAAIDDCFAGSFGAAGAEVVVEECMVGEEASFFALSDGETAVALATAQDHKRVHDGDTGPNTGGMGAYSPAPVMTDAMNARVMDEMILPTLRALKAMGTPYKGVLYAGVMITKDGPKLVEYNARFGDPECEVLMIRMMSDIVPALLAAVDGELRHFDLRWYPEPALTVIMATKGYPGDAPKGSRIEGLEEAARVEGVGIFRAGTKRVDGHIVANGGRVLNVCASGRTVREAQARAYRAVDLIRWPEGFCRRDIGWRAVERERTGS